MPEMSCFERAFCCGAVWRSSSATIARELRTQRLGRDILEIGAGSGSVAKQLLSSDPELGWTAIDIDPLMVHAAATRLREFPNASTKTADATALPFPGDSFDSVVSCLMLDHIIDWDARSPKWHVCCDPAEPSLAMTSPVHRWPVCFTVWTARRIG
jgi:SAM-dependent methyltransferase